MWPFRNKPPVPPPVPDRPRGFGYKMAWYAARTADAEGVAEMLGVTDRRDATWAEGVEALYQAPHFTAVMVTPPVAGWTLAAGWPLAPPDQGCDVPLVGRDAEALSERYGLACYFSTYRIVGMHVWAQARDGHLTRAFGYWADKSEMRWVVGEPTPEEETLGLVFPDAESRWVAARRPDDVDPPETPGEEHVVRAAGAWSIDPTVLEEAFTMPSLVRLGTVRRGARG